MENLNQDQTIQEQAQSFQNKRSFLRLKKIILSIIVLISILIFIPIPYYQDSVVLCKMGVSCPGIGWYPGPSLFQNLKSRLLFPASQKGETVDLSKYKKCPDGVTLVGRPCPNCEFSPCSTSKPKESSNDISTWKTYTNPKYGLSFEYPPQFEEYVDQLPWGVAVGCDCLFSEWFELEVIPTNLNPTQWWQRFGHRVFNGKVGETNDKFHEKAYTVVSELSKASGGRVYREIVAETDVKPTPIRFRILIFDSGDSLAVITVYDTVDRELFDQVLSTFKFTSTESSKAPSDWSLTTDNECNVVFSIPPKKAPYYKPQTTAEASTLSDEGKYWMFEETENLQNLLFRKVKLVRFANPNEGGSGYVAGMVTVSCGQNEKGYTTDTLLEEFRSNFTDGTFQGLELASVNSETKWNRKVYEVSVKGGMSDKNNLEYLFATGKNVYRIGWVSMASNPFVKETTETIFNNLNFKD